MLFNNFIATMQLNASSIITDDHSYGSGRAIRRYLENVHERLTDVVHVDYTIERIVKAIVTIHLWFPSIEQLDLCNLGTAIN